MRPIRYPFWKQQEAARNLARLGINVGREMIIERAKARKNYTRPERRLLPTARKVIKRQTCPCCGDPDSLTVERRRAATAYHNDELNFETSCIHCYQEHNEYWQDMWNDYYASR